MESSEQKILQKNLINFIIEDVFNAVSYSDVLKIRSKDVWEHKGKPLTALQIKSLKQEAEIMRQMSLWRMLHDELMWHAQRMLVNKSKGEEDLIAGKMLIYWISVIEARFRAMETGKEGGALVRIKE